MDCPLENICGGCAFRYLGEETYRALKVKNFEQVISGINNDSYKINPPVFISDGSRRRASFAFRYNKKRLLLGFNGKASHDIADISECPLLTRGLNEILPFVRKLLEAVCSEPYTVKKGKKQITQTISSGDVFVCEADNGIDIVLEYDAPLELSHRMAIFELSQSNNQVIRISHRRSAFAGVETIIEKSRPYIKAGRYSVLIPAGTFLQPSKEGQEALGRLVMQYLAGVKGNIADLFCGVGTFSYLTADLPDVKIKAVDSSESLLKGFKDSVNANRIPNIEIICKNLFKYPLDSNELKEFSAVVFDPPRAGAKAVCAELAVAENKPAVVVAVSCNPATFVNDANKLIDGGYNLAEITMVDQFVYSNHSELVACFTKRQI